MASVNAKAGWFSKRHQTNEAFLAYQAVKEARAQEQQRACEAREEAARNRTPQEQLKRLDSLLGPGQGAVKERARIARKIKAAKKESE
jgi:hypothetical protein